MSIHTNSQEEKYGSGIINISSEFVENDESDQVKFNILSSKVNLSFHQLYKYSQLVREQIQKEEIINYLQQKINNQIQNNIKEENIIIFFQLLKEQNVKISNDQYLDLFKLAEIFKVNSLINHLKKYAQNHSKDIDFILDIILEQKSSKIKSDDVILKYGQISSEMESCLSQNINECLQNKKFQSIPIPAIYRIIKRSSLEAIDHDMLYEFISKSIENRHILYQFIDLKKLSNDKFDELYQNYLSSKDSTIYYQYLPNNLQFIKEFKESQKLLEEEIKKLRAINENLQNQQNKTLGENKELQDQLKEFKEKNAQLENEIKISNKSRDDFKSQCQKLKGKTSQIQGIEFKFTSNFNGIINSLNKQCKGNCSVK